LRSWLAATVVHRNMFKLIYSSVQKGNQVAATPETVRSRRSTQLHVGASSSKSQRANSRFKRASELSSQPNLRPPFCGFIISFLVSAAGVACILLGEAFMTPTVIVGIVLLMSGATSTVFTFVLFFRIRKEHKDRAENQSRMSATKRAPDWKAHEQRLIDNDPLMRRPLIYLQFRSCPDTLSLHRGHHNHHAGGCGGHDLVEPMVTTGNCGTFGVVEDLIKYDHSNDCCETVT